MSNFQRYSAYYDLLYRDKDYAGEAGYVARKLREGAPQCRSLLELGSGTGRHGKLLAAMGFEVEGVELSADMVAIASRGEDQPGFACRVGDVRTASLDKTFDAVISLFHVVSYQAANDDLLAMFEVANRHLAPGGLFLFDVWHGPAVLTERPSQRTKEVVDARHRVRRTARPILDTNAGTVEVIYDLEGEDLENGETVQFSEHHVLRYLFPGEIDLLARMQGFEVVETEEFLTGEPVSEATWGVGYILRKADERG